MKNNIVIKGAREHNLKNISLELPRDKFIVITGLSGSGKSSLAFDTIYAEGQRRYVESLSSYARQFLGQLDKPDVDKIEGLSPAISIDQKSTNKNPRSTVGTVTEIHDYLRLLYARAGDVFCVKCGKKITCQTIDQMVDRLMSLPEGTKIMILAPVVRRKKGNHISVMESIKKDGFARAVIDGEIYDLDDEIKLARYENHSISAIVDRVIIKSGIEGRLAESVETSLKMASGLVIFKNMNTGEETLQSENYACPDCGISIEELSPRMFSFNSPYGACPYCSGLGSVMRIDVDLLVSDKNKTLREGAALASGWNLSMSSSIAYQQISALAKKYDFSLDVPWKDLSDDVRNIILYGCDEKVKVEYSGENMSGQYMTKFEGVVNNLERRYHESKSDSVKSEIERYMREEVCHVCQGRRYRPETLSVKIGDKNISELSDMSILNIKKYLGSVSFTENQKIISAQIIKEINARLDFLIHVGLDYLTLSRSAGTLSGGEAQRIRLATQIGSGLMGVMYILDEPSIGLHQRDNSKLLDALKGLRDLGNTLIVVEHDEETMRAADYIVDIGPGAGAYGGRIVAAGTPNQVMKCADSVTGQYLSGVRRIRVPETRRIPKGWITIKGAKANNLKNITVDFPLGVLTCVTGVSGSGKSTLVNYTLKAAIAHKIYGTKGHVGEFDSLDGIEQIDKIIDIDQSPIGRTPRSNPATYTGVFDYIRDVFAMSHDAKVRGYDKGRFSFNVKGGRCEACKGDGIIKIEMHFLSDVYVPCDVCHGKRYNRETLDVKYKGKNIFEVLDMTVAEAYDFFRNIPSIENKLKLLMDVGLSYIKLGQPSTTLSGGEAQRIKLATYLSKRPTGKTMFVLDEPTTGLHSEDIKKLISVLDRLTESGNSVIVIEHNLDVIKCADYIIDLGPDGGEYGGDVVAVGTPEKIAVIPESATGQYLNRILFGDGK